MLMAPLTNRPSPPRLPFSSSSSSSSSLCPCGVMSGTDRVVIFLVIVAIIWLSGLIVYINTTKSLPLDVHIHHNVFTNLPGLDSLDSPDFSSSLPPTPPSPPSPASVPSPTTVPSPALVTVDDSEVVISSWASLPNPGLIVLTYNRPIYLQQTLEAIIRCEGFAHFHLYVSQDGSSPDLTPLLSPYNLTLLHHPRIPLLSPTQSGTAFLAQHYKWAFDELFVRGNHSHVVVVEDDMTVSPDFLILFRDTADLLANDPSVFCVSSWHDNGRRGLVYDPYRLFRTSYFPGLGWMMRKELWDELSGVFPLDQWDHFMRLDTVHRGRSCIVPEVSRNKNIGEQGTNMGNSFFSRYLEPIAWEQKGVKSFNRGKNGLQHMKLEAYNEELRRELEEAEVLGNIADGRTRQALEEVRQRGGGGRGGPVDGKVRRSIVVYKREDWRFISDAFSLLSVPRCTHRGISVLRIASHMRSVDEPQLLDSSTSSALSDSSHWIYLVDVRHVNFSLHLPSWLFPSSPHHQLVWKASTALRPQQSQQGENCVTACSRSGMVCDGDYFSVLNECSVLHQYFGCERGCVGGVVGLDVPNYVSSAEKPEVVKQCLTTEESPECAASHWSAQRLCPCVPSSGQG